MTGSTTTAKIGEGKRMENDSEKEIFTENQKLLLKYFAVVKMPKVQVIYTISILWDEAATMEMLKYIAYTREKDPNVLCDVARRISSKYDFDDDDEDDNYDD